MNGDVMTASASAADVVGAMAMLHRLTASRLRQTYQSCRRIRFGLRRRGAL
jgi:hypothetical protein